jgi:hypothetical protein
MRKTLSLVLLALVMSLPVHSWAAEPTKEETPAVEKKAEEAAPATEEKKAEEPKKAEESKKAEEAKVVDPIEPPETVTEAMEDLGILIDAAKNGNWVLFSGLLILLLIFVLDKLVNLKERIPAKAVPWVAAGLGILSSIGVQLTAPIPWGQAVLQGLTSGIVAVGLWELIFQHVLKKKEESTETKAAE